MKFHLLITKCLVFKIQASCTDIIFANMTFLVFVSCLSVLLVSASAYPSQARDWEEKVFLSVEKGRPLPGTKGVIHHRPYQTRVQGRSSLYYYNNREVLYRLDVVPCSVKEPPPG